MCVRVCLNLSLFLSFFLSFFISFFLYFLLSLFLSFCICVCFCLIGVSSAWTDNQFCWHKSYDVKCGNPLAFANRTGYLRFFLQCISSWFFCDPVSLFKLCCISHCPVTSTGPYTFIRNFTNCNVFVNTSTLYGEIVY